jgi:ribonuclease P protein component
MAVSAAKNTKKTNRISKTRELQNVFRFGRAVHAATLVIKFVKNPKEKQSRTAFVISKKVSKKAVVRNKIRRVMREELRRNLLPGMPIGDYVIMVKPLAAKLENQELRNEISSAARRIRS